VFSTFFSNLGCEVGSYCSEIKVNISSLKLPDREKVYNVEELTVCPKEQLLFFDIEVQAYDVSAGRSLAYNAFLEFVSFLAVLLDIGFKPFQTEENLLLLDQHVYADNYKFYSTVGSKGFDDTELNILVYDNLNGLIAVDANGQLIKNEYISITVPESSNGISVVTRAKYNEKLENIFKKRAIEDVKKSYPSQKIDKELCFYNSSPSILTSHIKFFRKIKVFEANEKEKYLYFLHACKMYNLALTVCSNEPTMLIAYLISSLDILSKTEKSCEYLKEGKSDMDKFLLFSKQYWDDKDFDKKFFQYLYGNIRSGHFHSGEFKFFEYNLTLSQSFNMSFFEIQQEYYIRAKKEIRKIFINWIEKNVLPYGDKTL